ncbi:MAG: anti-sigma factor [Fibrobacteres bacterium]|nr:anti-sigma factor [Fibrobacterota bacterium]
MDCPRFLELLHPWLDGELDLVNALEMERHSDGCGACLAESAALRDLKARLSHGALAFAAPPGLAARIRASLPVASPASVPPALPASDGSGSKRWRPWHRPRARLGAAGLVSALLALALGFWAMNAGFRRDALAGEMVACHVRSLQADHLFDVASTDRHTVKPWFTGKLDFSPPVADFSEEGFPLVGGRLEYLGGHPVAALVYRRHLHVINVFCWPAASGDNGRATPKTLQGYHVVFWSRDGFRLGAVSDLNAEELGQFVELMKR